MKKTVLPALVAGTAALLTACSTTVTGQATDSAGNTAGASVAPSTIAVPAGLDVGANPTTTRALAPLDDKSGWVAEGNRMADALIQVNEVDKRMRIGGVGLRSYPVIEGGQLSGRVPDSTAVTFATYNMKVGMTTTRGDAFDDPTIAMRIGLYRFGSPDDATKAFESIQRRTERNGQSEVKLTGPNTDGTTASEFKPGTVDSYRVEGPFVINISGTSSSTAEATKLVAKGYELEVPKLKSFTPTPVGQVASLPKDIEGTLSRTIPSTVTGYAASVANGVYGMNGLLHRIRDIDDAGVYSKAGIDAVAQGETVVYRTRDAAAAAQLVTDLAAINTRLGKRVGSPAQLPGMICVERPGNINCAVSAGRWVTTAGGDTLQQAQQRASAQYTILAQHP